MDGWSIISKVFLVDALQREWSVIINDWSSQMENNEQRKNENYTIKEIKGSEIQQSDKLGNIQDVANKKTKKGLGAFWEKSVGNKILVILVISMIFVLIFATILAISIANQEQEAHAWPDTELSKLIPEPNGKITYVNTDDNELDATVETNAKKAYEYRTKCKEMGFTNISEDENDDNDFSFKARDTNNNELSLTYYEDNGELEIELKKLGQSEASSSTSSSNSTNTSSNFKDMMNSYEKFIDEYIAFMKKYKNSSDTAAMIEDYSNYIDRLSDFSNKIDALDKDELSTEDYKYYIEVTTRVKKKLASIGE